MRITPGAVVKGGTSLEYKTGSWRDEKPVMDLEVCNSCGTCKDVCPENCVKEGEDRYSIDYDYCKGCGLCAHECPAKAIQMIAEEK